MELNERNGTWKWNLMKEMELNEEMELLHGSDHEKEGRVQKPVQQSVILYGERNRPKCLCNVNFKNVATMTMSQKLKHTCT